MAESTARKQRGRPFVKGQSGNPSGRPRGARNRATLAAEALLDGEAEALTRRVIEWALAGDPMAMRICMERILPPRRDRPVSIGLPAVTSAKDGAAAMAAILAAVGDGELTPAEASVVSSITLAAVRAFDIAANDRQSRKEELDLRPTEDARAALRAKIEDFARRIRAQKDAAHTPDDGDAVTASDDRNRPEFVPGEV